MKERDPSNGGPGSADAHDTSSEGMAERRRDVRLAVTQILAEGADVESAAPRILGAVCEALGWDVGTFWRVDPERGVLRCQAFWQDPARDLDRFQAASLDIAFRPGESLPGRAWATGRPQWVADATSDPGFVRAPQAAEEGLRGAFAWPIRVGDDFLGVLEFFSLEIQPPDEDLLELAATLGGQIGQFIERHHAEAELRRRERDLTDFFENATMGLHWVGPDGTILRANRCELELLGYREEEYVGHHIAEFHVDREVIDDILKRLSAGEALNAYPARMRCKDGSIRHVLINSNVLFEDGDFIHTRCFTRDVTEELRLRAELERRVEELTEAEARVRSVVDHVVDGIITIDASGTVESFNPAAERIFGYQASEVRGRNVKMLMPPPYREEHDGYIESYHRTGVAKIIGIGREVVGRRKDGSVFPMDLAVSDFRHGERRFFTGIVRDITDRKRLENALRFLADASRTLSSLHDWRSTLQAIARLAVPSYADWCTVHVAGDDGAVETVAVSHVDPDRIAAVQELGADLPQALRAGEPLLIPELGPADRRSLADGERQLRLLEELRPVSILSVPLETDARVFGAVTFVSAESGGRYGTEDLEMVQDLAHRTGVAIENARLYEKLRQEDRRKDEFLAMLSHELRNPLAPIRTGLEVLALRHGSDRTIESMQNQIVHLVRLVDDLLDVSRIMRGRVELRQQTVELASVVEQAVAAVQPQVDQREQELVVSLPEEPVSLFADPVRLVQVLENLLSNASKYNGAGGRIALTVESQDDTVEIAVKDDGIGIEPELLPQIFELFAQSPRSLERSQGGLGIGLTLVRQLVTLHGGSVSAHSAGPGEGSELIVRLPITRESGAAQAVEPQAPARRDHRILVVDDNADAAEMLSLLLRTVGDYDVEVAYDGPSALEKVRKTRPDVILLDIGLPGLDGYQVGRKMRNDPGFDGTLLVAVTGYGQEEDRRRSRDAGFDEHLVKPVAVTELERVLAHGKLQR